VRIAVNRVLVRRGKVFADRYHARALRSPTEVANAIDYVLGNTMIHAARRGRPADPDAVDFLATPRTWLLRIGWTLGLPAP
jgi:hypothetical protein